MGLLTENRALVFPHKTVQHSSFGGVSVTFRLGKKLSKRWLKKALTVGALMPLSWPAVSAPNSSRAKLKPAATAAKASVTTELPKALPAATTSAEMGLKPKSAAPSVLSGNLRFEGMQYLKEVPESPNLTNSQFLSARLSAIGSFESVPALSYAGDFSAGTFFSQSQTQFVVHEANLEMPVGLSKTTAAIGRKKAPWSALDERWQLGMWQPQFAIDALRPEDQGLTGLFLDVKDSNFELLGFVSPIFIPTMGPDIREEGGGLKSDSRWYREPSTQTSINSKIKSISYSIDVPETSKLVMNPSSAIMGRWGSRERGPWIAGAWGYKPVNALLLKHEIIQSINTDGVDVTLSPDVDYHNIFSMDAGYAFDTVQASVSMLEDRPSGKAPGQDEAIQRLEPAKAYSVQLDWLVRNFFNKTVQVQLSYLKINGGGITDVTANGRPDDITLFDSRFKFTDAASIGLQGQLLQIYRRPLIGKFRYLYDWDQRGSLVNSELQLYPEKSWAVVMGADVLGVDDETYKPSGFLNQFRANDRVYGGMSYVF